MMMLGKEPHLYLSQGFFCRSAAFAEGKGEGVKFFSEFRYCPRHFQVLRWWRGGLPDLGRT